MALSYSKALAILESRGFGITPGLQRIETLMKVLDEPQLKFPTVHLAGTNGKGSTARMITTILAAHGLNTGLYTSPHLNEVTERFVLASWDEGLIWEQMSHDELAGTMSYLLPFTELVENDMGETLTYFELTTALAFEWMSERSVGAGVIETGLGGRWDATNLVNSTVAVLAPIDVDHAQFLGTTPHANALEKVDIVKEGSTVVSAAQPPEVLELMEARAGEVGAATIVAGRDLLLDANDTAVGGRLVSLRTPQSSYEGLFLPLHGAHQGENLALAVAAAEAFLHRGLDFDLLQTALISVTSPGRLEVAGRQPLVVLDGAHNPHAARALKAALTSEFLFKSLTMVIAVFEDKDIQGILKELVPSADRVIFARADNPRASSPKALAGAAPVVPGQDPPELMESVEAAVDRALSVSDEDDMVLITGSLHAVGEARAHLIDKGARG